MTPTEVAAVAHALQQAYIRYSDPNAIPPLDILDNKRQVSTLQAVVGLMDGRSLPAMHETWRHMKVEQGWTVAPEFDLATRTNPSLVPYDQLSMRRHEADRLVVLLVAHFQPGSGVAVPRESE